MMEGADKKQSKKNARGGSETMFPGRLHDLLEYVESQGLDYIVSWVRNGTAFMVHKPDELLQLLSFFFGQTKYRSFTRQLNMWYFEREEFGPYKGCFSHPFFVKHNKELCSKMSRHEPPKRNIASPRLSQVEGSNPTIIGSSFNPLGDIELRPQAAVMSTIWNSEEKSYRRNPSDVVKSITGFNGFGVVHDDLFAEHDQPTDVRTTTASDHLSFLNNSLFTLSPANSLEPNPIVERCEPASASQENMLEDDFSNILPLMSMITHPSSETQRYNSLQNLQEDDDGLYLLRLLQKGA